MRHSANTPRGSMISICGNEGAGKTTFALSTPEPRAIVHIDPNTEEIVEQAGGASAATLYRVGYPAVAFGDKDAIKEQAEKIWDDQLIGPLTEILTARKRPATLVIDTATDIRDLQLLKWFGKTAQIIKELYTGPNMEMKGMLNSLRHSGMHVVLLHRLKDVYEMKMVRTKSGPEEKSERVPGEYQRDGFNKTGFFVNVEAFVFHDPKRSDKLPSQFGMKIARCTARPSLIGTEYWGRERLDDDTRIRRASFPYLMQLVYPSTTLDDWR